MRALRYLLITFLLLNYSAVFSDNFCKPGGDASECDKVSCCGKMGGIRYCDSSAGRYVCNNGDYSDCYCTRHAIMDLQKIQGCCLWQGGVMAIDPLGLVICRNGGVSEPCTLQSSPQPVSSW